MGNRFLIFSLAALGAVVAVAGPTMTQYNWDGTSGAYNDPDRWDRKAVPGETSLAFVENKSSTPTVVTFPAGEFETKASQRYNVTGGGSSLTMDGSGTVFRMPTCSAENYHDEPFGFRLAGNHHFNFQTYSDLAADHWKHSICVISNGIWRASRPAEGGFRVDFDQGVFNFYDPDGNAYPRSYFMMCNNTYGGNVTVAFHPGTRTRTPAWQIPNNLNNGYTARLAFLGGEHEICGTMEMPVNVHYTDNHIGDTVIDVTNNATLAVKGVVKVGAITSTAPYFSNGKSSDLNSRYFFNVSDGGRLAFESDFTQQNSGPLFVNAEEGGVIRFGGNATIGCEQSTGTVAVAACGRLEGNVILSGKGLARLNVAAGGVADLDYLNIGRDDVGADLSVAPGGTLRVKDFRLARGEIVVPVGGAWTNVAMYLGHSGGPGVHMAIPAGAAICSTHQLITGHQSGGATLDLTGGDVNVGVFRIGTYASATGEVNITAGTLTVATNLIGGAGRSTLNISGGRVATSSMYLPYPPGEASANTYGIVNMSGGELDVKDSLGIGYKYGGDLNVSGGETTCHYLFIGQGVNNADPYGGTFRMTGGKFTTTTENRADVGVKVADAAGRRGHVILDGGELHTTRIFGWTGAKCRGGTGLATFSADGGTIVVRSAVSDLILDFDSAELGAQGLTVKSDYACPISQSFANKADAEGVLVLAGSGEKTLSPTNSTISRLVAAGGTVKFVPGVGGVQAKQDSSIVVTNGATLSLVGGQTSLDVRDFTLGDAVTPGRLALDAGDVIRVSGTLVVNDGVIVVSDGFTVGAEYTFIELVGDHSEALADAWSNLRVVSATPGDGRAYTFKVQYDEGAGKTGVKLQVFQSSSAAGSATWKGPGAEWTTDANWEGGAKPGATDKAVFSSETAPAAVNVAGAVQAAGLEFSADRGYSVSGGKIVLSALDDTAITATKGSNTVAAALSLPPGLPVATASGSAVVLEGRVQGGDLVKTGPGRLALAGDNNDLFSVGLSNGTFAVASPGALGGASEILQTGGTLEFGGAAGGDSRYPQNLTTRAPDAKAPVIFKATGDVTMKMPAFSSGVPYKTGPGRITFESASLADLTHGEGGAGDWWYKAGFDLDADGQIPAETLLAGFNIAEGEVRLKGTAAGVVFRCGYYLGVGVPQLSAKGTAALTIDGATLNNAFSSKHLMLGSGISDVNTGVGTVCFTATNGAMVSADTFYVGRGNTRAGMRTRTLFDNSTLKSSYMMQANCGSGDDSLAEFVFRNKSALYTTRVNTPYRAKFVFDDSVYAKNANGLPAEITYNVNITGTTKSGADWEFRNGSVLVCNKVEAYGWPNQPTTLKFDGSEWRTGADDFTFVYPHPAQVRFLVENEGLVLAPPAGGTWTLQNAVSGAGGIVKRGAGTLVFDLFKRIDSNTQQVVAYPSATNTMCFTGTAKVEAGTLRIVGGASAGTASVAIAAEATLDLAGGATTLAAVTGPGTVVNGTISCTLSAISPEAMPVFDANTVTLAHPTFDAGCSAESPYVKSPEPVAVARYTGAAPTIAGGRSINTGVPGSLATFTAKDGFIYANVVYRGITINFR